MKKSPKTPKKMAQKEHKEHQAAIKPLLKHLKADEKKMAKAKKGCY